MDLASPSALQGGPARGRRSISSEQLRWLDGLATRQDGTPGPLRELAPELAAMEWLNRVTPREWRRAARDAAPDTLKRLIRLLTLAEKEFHWVGGSAAATIWLFQMLEERDPSRSRVVAGWVLANRGDNTYVPFGRRTTAGNFEEYLTEQRSEWARRNAHFEREWKQPLNAQRRRRTRAEVHETRVLVARARSVERRAEIGRLQARPNGLALSDLVHRWPLPLDAFPLDLIEDQDAAVAALDPETRRFLAEMIDRRGGPWRRLKQKLTGKSE